MRVFSRGAALCLALCLLACDDPERGNAASTEASPLVPAVAAPGVAHTFAQTHTTDGRVATLLVASLAGETVEAMDLTAIGAPLDADVFEVLSALGELRLQEALAGPSLRRSYRVADLLPAAGTAERHLASGTNFPEHAREAAIGEVFNFPKFGPASPARTTVELRPGALLDYEVEICTRFDRDIRSVADFDAARKGFFLCGDFSERATLMRMIDPDDVASGQGFSDAKSGADYFPTGPFLVVPHDWQAFVGSERITTRVNGRIRQDARGGEMILDFRALVEKALTHGGSGQYVYRGAPVPLLENETIPRGATVMSGTSEGVIFMPPGITDLIAGGMNHLFTGPLLRGERLARTVVKTYIRREQRSGRYLRAGDVVEHASSSMGDVRIRVLPPAPALARIGRRDIVRLCCAPGAEDSAH
ncbi:fumarylacetoacetate hydrolase family protein [Roseomonas sp. WA12]